MVFNEAHVVPTPTADPELLPQRVLESILSELEYRLLEAQPWMHSNLFELHAALLVYNLRGESSLLPEPSFGVSARRLRERRLVRTARRITQAGQGDSTVAVRLAADVIDRHIALIDPALASSAA